MREILFRGKQKQYPNDWIEGMFTIGKFAGREHHCIERRERRIISYDYEWVMQPYEVISETVGQYTGLTDKNGKKIFEGDIVEWYLDYDDTWGYSHTAEYCGVVVWNVNDYCWNIKANDELIMFNECDWDISMVIGNIHDNSELLKGGAEE